MINAMGVLRSAYRYRFSLLSIFIALAVPIAIAQYAEHLYFQGAWAANSPLPFNLELIETAWVLVSIILADIGFHREPTPVGAAVAASWAFFIYLLAQAV